MNICAYNGHGGVIPTRLCKKRQATSRCLPSIVISSCFMPPCLRGTFSVPRRKLFCGHVAYLLRHSRGVRSSAPCRKLPGRRFRALAYLTYALTRRCRFACRLISSPRLSRRSRRRCGGCRRKNSRPRDGRASSCPRRARERIRRKRPRCPL